MKRNFKLLVAVVVLVAMVMTLASCEFVNGIWNKINPKPHEHAFSEDWSSDETNHWHAATCTDTEECASQKKDVAEHTFADGKCTVCQAVDPNYDAPCAQHTFTVETTKAPTCTEAGEKTLTCTACGHTEKQTVAALDHTEEPLKGKAPTCTEAGLSEGKKCTTCGVTTVEQTPINALSHDYAGGQFCVRENCGAENPDYTGPKTYEWNFGLVDGGDAPADKTAIAEGTTYVGGYFTIVGTVKYRYNDEKASIHCVEVDKQAKGAIEFTVTGTATVEVQFSSTGSSNTSLVGIIDANGNLVPNNEGIDRVTGASAGMTVLTYNLTPGTYRVVSHDTTDIAVDEDGNYLINEKVEANPQTWAQYYNRGARVFYVKVTETPMAKFDVETTDNNCWVDEYTFTADKAGTYTFFVPAGLGIWNVKSYDNDISPEVDYTFNENGASFSKVLAEGEEFKFYIGGEEKKTWEIPYSYSDVMPEPDGSYDYPFVWETLPESVTLESTDIFSLTHFTFTAAADGTVTFTWPTADSWFAYGVYEDGVLVGSLTENNGNVTYTMLVEAGKKYIVGLSTWYDPAENLNVTIAFTACDHVWSEATCSALATCATCGCTKGEKLDHTPGAAATCTTDQVCTECGYVINYAAHTWDEENPVVDPDNCAKKTYNCLNCDATDARDSWWLHEIVDDEDIEATCTTDGSYKAHCSNEGCKYTVSEERPATGHFNYDIACGETGVCLAEGCGVEFTKVHWGEDATCTEAMYCYNCFGYVGDPLGHNWVDGVCDRCEAKMTIADALAAAVGTKVEITGTVSGFYEAWSSYGNCSPYIVDADGNKILVFRTTVHVYDGDVITVKGVIGQYNNVNQIAKDGLTVTVDTPHTCNYANATCTAPSSCTSCGAVKADSVALGHTFVDGVCSTCGAKDVVYKLAASLSFASKDNRVSQTTSEQVWSANNITFTNTGSVADYANPVRLYKNSKITIDYTGMSKIVFNCVSNYCTFPETIEGATVTHDGTTVTVEFDAPVNTITITLSVAQVRLNSLDIYTIEA